MARYVTLKLTALEADTLRFILIAWLPDSEATTKPATRILHKVEAELAK